MEDWGGIDIGIDPGSIDYGGGSDLSNAQIQDQIGGGDWIDAIANWGNGFDGSASEPIDGGALGQAYDTQGSPNVRSPSSDDLKSVMGGSSGGDKSLVSKIGSLFEDKKTGELDINKILKFGLGLGSFASSMSNRGKASSNQLQQQLQQQRNSTWTPQQSVWAQYFQTPTNFDRPRQSAASMPSPIVPSRGYAGGGTVGPTDIWTAARRRREQEAGLEDYNPQTLQPGTNRRVPEGQRVPVSDLLRSVPLLLKSLFEGEEKPKGKDYAEGGDVPGDIFSGFVVGQGGGQSDVVQANLSPGEYVLDTDIVSAIGDGSNEEGARILDAWKEQLRVMKREAPSDQIPPSMEETGLQLPMPGAEGEV